MYFVFPRVHHNTYVVAGDIIQFGSTTVFRFNHPQEAAEMKDEVIAVCVAVQVLYRFSILLLYYFTTFPTGTKQRETFGTLATFTTVLIYI